MAQADRLGWIWPWCGRLVAGFGRANVDNARQAAPFWQRYVKANPEHAAARWELLMTTFYLRGQGENIGRSYNEFREEFDRHIAHVDPENAALAWDRLGHWAQDDEDWVEAERCFRKAYDLAGGEYGYCLAIALKSLERFEESVPLLLERFEESVPLLLEQAQIVQPDAMSWFQLATSYASLGNWREAIDAYERALALDPEYAVAMFDLGGAHWNSGDAATVAEVWAAAMERFPDHELSAKVRCDFSFLFSDPGAGEFGDGAR
ncbi:tetratricopeptide repeat protein [Bradyrhizobium sp. 139]|nr:tetratricopeptide repeat protein [Bradyrhizobium sp. 139]